jgi:hypothetical protein
MNLNAMFLNLTDKIDWVVNASAFGELDRESKAILIFIAKRQLDNVEVCATDIIQNQRMPGSPVTLFNRIHRLKRLGWILSEASDQHHRKVRLSLSTLAIENINMISTLLEHELGIKL